MTKACGEDMDRAPTYNLSRMVLTLLLCLFYGSLYFGQGRIPQTGPTFSLAPCRKVAPP